jgi:hypothetical protein
MTPASIATAAVALALAVPAGAVNARKPSLTLLGLEPAKLRGTHFKAGEKVGISLEAEQTRILRTVRVSAQGGFTVVLGSLTLGDRCRSGAVLVASGTFGDRTLVKLPRTGCPAPLTPTAPGPPPVTTTTTTGNYIAPPPPYTT